MLGKSLVQRISVPRASIPFRGLVLATLVGVFGLIILGGIVRVTESGLGCPDWPLCNGRAIPPAEFHALIEYTHRLVATIVGVLAVGVVGISLLYYRADRAALAFSLAFAALLVTQIILGGVTVEAELPPNIVTAHLGIALATLALLTGFAAYLYRPAPARAVGPPVARAATPSPWLLPVSLLAAAATYGVAISGSYMVGAGATAGCHGWPLCPGGFPDGRIEAIALAHRLVVLLGAALTLAAAALAWRCRKAWPPLGWVAGVLVALFVSQALVGAANVWLEYSAAVRSAHLALSTAVWTGAVLLAIMAFQAQGRREVA